MPKELVQGGSPPCTDLLEDASAVFMDPDRWPAHLCVKQFMRRSTEEWARGTARSVTQPATSLWMVQYPLPIGQRAVMIDRDLRGLEHIDDGLEGVTELLDTVPFKEYEAAMWALRIENRNFTNVSALDLFGLAEYPTEEHRRLGVAVAGPLAYVVRGQDKRLIDLLGHAQKWWDQYRGLILRGRPPGTGIWTGAEDFEKEVRQTVEQMRVIGEKVTQENVAEKLAVGDRTFRRWLKRCGINWSEIRNH